MKPEYKKRTRKVKNYVNNKDMLDAVKDWKTKKELDENYQLPEYIGNCFLQIAKRYATRPNFRDYTYIDDMVSDALLACVKYAHNFNPEKSDNPFAYFTKIVENSFLQKLNKEKKESDKKFFLVGMLVENSHKKNYNNITSHIEKVFE